MRLLLDTHVLLWALAGDRRLLASARGAVEDPANELVVSAASAWEIGIKRALGKLRAPDELPEALSRSGMVTLPITVDHAVAAGALPRHHDDPFDRMLIAQARAEHLRLVTADRRFSLYPVEILEV